MHKSGALLLEASDGHDLDIYLQRRQAPEPAQMLLGAPSAGLPIGSWQGSHARLKVPGVTQRTGRAMATKNMHREGRRGMAEEQRSTMTLGMGLAMTTVTRRIRDHASLTVQAQAATKRRPSGCKVAPHVPHASLLSIAKLSVAFPAVLALNGLHGLALQSQRRAAGRPAGAGASLRRKPFMTLMNPWTRTTPARSPCGPSAS